MCRLNLQTVKILLTVLIAIISASAATSAQSIDVGRPDDVERIALRLQKAEHLNLLQAAMWTVTHDYRDHKHTDDVVKSVFAYLDALQKYQIGDKEPLTKLDGVRGLSAKLSDMLQDPDPAIRAFAAVLIGIVGDNTLAPVLAELLKDRLLADGELLRYDRGRAATALGLLGAVEYKPRLAELLKSKNQYDRAGAISALGYFRATEYGDAIAALLGRTDLGVDDDPSPVYFLVDTAIAGNYKPQLVKAMLGKFQSDTAEAAMWALVRIDAKEHAKEIARLLSDEFKKGDAAKALALLGATEYTVRIAGLLNDKSGLVRSSALLALGVLNAKSHEAAVARALQDPESYVRSYSATSLLLMQAKRHYGAALPFLEKPDAGRAYLTDSSFSPLVAEKTHVITQRLIKAIQTAKATSSP
jgi:HEAT repeat protein